MKISYSASADQDLEEIWQNVVTASGPDGADKMIRTLGSTCTMLQRFPSIGRTHPDHRGLRSFPCARYQIFYSLHLGTVIIRRILHSARDLHELLRSTWRVKLYYFPSPPTGPAIRALAPSAAS